MFGGIQNRSLIQLSSKQTGFNSKWIAPHSSGALSRSLFLRNRPQPGRPPALASERENGAPLFSAGGPSKNVGLPMETPNEDLQYAPRSVPPAAARPFPPAAGAFPVIAAAAKEKSWFNSPRGRVPRVAGQARGEHWVRLNIVRFVPGEVGKIQRSSRHTPRLDRGQRLV